MSIRTKSTGGAAYTVNVATGENPAAPLTVPDTAIGIPAGYVSKDGVRAIYALLTIEDAPIRYSFDEDPTATFGHLADPGTYLALDSEAQIKALKMIRVGDTSAKVQITVEF